MAEAWATFGIDLHLAPAGRHVRAGLEGALRDAVRTGRLRPGTRLPSSRTLAGDLGIARNTVADAYGQLVVEGWLTATPGSATRVGDQAASIDVAASQVATANVSRPRFDLRAGSPNLSAFPRPAWLAASRRALENAPYEAFGYSDPRGRPELRRALADYLSRTRGVRANPDRIIISSGFTQGLGLLCSVLRARDARTLAIEPYGQPSHRAVATAGGLSLQRLTVDMQGAVVSDAGDANAMLLTPAHQFPVGVALWPQRRNQAVAWARDTAGLIIEDDYDGEFRYDRQPVGAVQALAPQHVVYAGSASKSLAPGLRLGWLVLPLISSTISPRPNCWPTDQAAPSTNSPWPSSSPAAPTTGTFAARGSPTVGDETGWWRPCNVRLRTSAPQVSQPVCTFSWKAPRSCAGRGVWHATRARVHWSRCSSLRRNHWFRDRCECHNRNSSDTFVPLEGVATTAIAGSVTSRTAECRRPPAEVPARPTWRGSRGLKGGAGCPGCR